MTWTSPSAVELVILCLAAFRLTRLAGWDQFAPVALARCWITGWRDPRHDEGADPVRVRDRPGWLADLFECPFCLGFWISLALAFAWWAWPLAALAFCLPWALSGAAGLLAKNLDP